MSEGTAQRTYHPALDGLRGVASLLVVFYHNFEFINRYFFFGWIGLDIFFVLSGFLITSILLSTVEQPGYLKKFYVRRMLRIFPLYYATLIVVLLILPRIPALPVRLDYYVEHQVWLWTYLQNWIYIFQPATDQNALTHLWSLAVEEQFYLLWPLVIAVLPRPKFLLLFIAGLLLVTVGLRTWLWLNQVEGLSYFSLYTFTRIDGICIGCMVAILHRLRPGILQRNTAVVVLAFAAVNFLFYFVNRAYNNSFPYLAMVGYTTLAMLIGLLVSDIASGQPSVFRRVLSIRPLRFLGRISYGCYIIHWPLYLLTAPALESWIQQQLPWMPQYYASSAIITILSYFLGYLSFRYFETPFLKLKRRFGGG